MCECASPLTANEKKNIFQFSSTPSNSFVNVTAPEENCVINMSTSKQSFCTSKNKDVQERNSATSVNKKGEMLKDKRRNLPCDLAKKLMYPPEFRNWPILSLLKQEFIIQIRMVMVYGNRGNRALIVTKDKNVYTLDFNKNGDTRIGLYPKMIEELCGKNIKTFACNSFFVLALTEKGEVYSWEFNKMMKSDDGSQTSVFTRVAGLNDKYIEDIACGSSHSLALSNDGKVYAWGQIMGNENSNIFGSPRQVKHKLEKQKIVHIACGSTFNMVVTKTGKLYGWGNNESCQIAPNFIHNFNTTSTSTNSTSDLSLATYSNTKAMLNKTTLNKVEIKFYSYPHEITAHRTLLGEIVKVACGFEHILALTNEGKVYAWGKNDKGQVGKIFIVPSFIPVKVDIPEKAKDIAAYGNLSVAESNNKIIYIWGDCFGQVPVPMGFSRIDDAFAYSESKVMYRPLIISTDDYNYIEEVLDKLKSLGEEFDDPSISDLTVQVEGKCIYVHKTILQTFSQYFKDDFRRYGVPRKLYKSDFSYIVYKAFFKYLYTGTIDLPSEYALDLMKLADKCGETSLSFKRECGRIIEQAITVSNVAFFYDEAIKYDAQELEEFCFQFAMCHMNEVTDTDHFNKLDMNIKYKLLFKANKIYSNQKSPK